MRISQTLIAVDKEDGTYVCCVACSEPLAELGSDPHWKHRSKVAEQLCSGLPGWSSSVHPDLMLRQFVCPSCGHLLDSETALPGDPFLYDRIEV